RRGRRRLPAARPKWSAGMTIADHDTPDAVRGGQTTPGAPRSSGDAGPTSALTRGAAASKADGGAPKGPSATPHGPSATSQGPSAAPKVPSADPKNGGAAAKRDTAGPARDTVATKANPRRGKRRPVPSPATGGSSARAKPSPTHKPGPK